MGESNFELFSFLPSSPRKRAIRVDRERREVYRKYDCIFVSIRPRVVKSVNRVLNVQDRRIIWRDIVEFLIIYGSIIVRKDRS